LTFLIVKKFRKEKGQAFESLGQEVAKRVRIILKTVKIQSNSEESEDQRGPEISILIFYHKI